MIKIVAGARGKGKTKHLLELVNRAIETASGNIVYLDKNKKHMYELNNRIRLIDVTEFKLVNCDEFIGFLAGILSQDHDLEEVYLDSFLTISAVKEEELDHVLERLQLISEQYHTNFVLSISKNQEHLPERLHEMIIKSL